MKQLTNLFFLFLTINVCAQTLEQTTNWENQILANQFLFKKEYKDSITKYDLGSLWTFTDNRYVFGFIGENCQRIRIKLISISKDKNHSDIYNVVGKSMVKNNICQFEGTIKITNVRIYNNIQCAKYFGVPQDKKIKEQGILFAEYHFSEDSSQIHSGAFNGIIHAAWYINKDDILKYDDTNTSDGATNNEFVGTWKSYKNNVTKICNWGDYRIPFSGRFDNGAGEFHPGNIDSQNGWQTYHYAHGETEDKNKIEQAKQEEIREWWK